MVSSPEIWTPCIDHLTKENDLKGLKAMQMSDWDFMLTAASQACFPGFRGFIGWPDMWDMLLRTVK